jgi:hypothetical protein
MGRPSVRLFESVARPQKLWLVNRDFSPNSTSVLMGDSRRPSERSCVGGWRHEIDHREARGLEGSRLSHLECADFVIRTVTPFLTSRKKSRAERQNDPETGPDDTYAAPSEKGIRRVLFEARPSQRVPSPGPLGGFSKKRVSFRAVSLPNFPGGTGLPPRGS